MEKRLPKGWRTARLREVCEFVYGDSLPEKNRKEGEVPVYGSNGIVGIHDIAITEGETIIVGRKGSVGEVNYSRMPCFPIDTTYFIDGRYTDQNLIWLFWLLKTLNLGKLSLMVGVPGLNRRDAYKLQIPLPPLATQKKIAGILEEADSLRKLRRQADEKMRDLIPSLFAEMFGDPATNPKGWEIKSLGDVAKIILGSTPRTDKPEYWDGDILWVTPADLSNLDSIVISKTRRSITKEGYESCSTMILPAGTVLFSSRAPIGHLAIVGKEMCTNQGFKSLVPKENAHSIYLYFVLKYFKERLINLGSGATFKEISKTSVERFQIPLPPLPLQKEFAARVEEIEAEKTRQADSKNKLDELFNSLMHRAFAGELVA